MEVHHHPDLHHQKKKLLEYFFEFVMIFLAVTLGFFAETIRERISAKEREKNYIAGLISNVQSDTAILRGLINRNDAELRGIDSLLKVSKQNFSNIQGQDSIFYYALEYTFALHIFEFNDLTLVQLRNAGGYSLIKTAKVSDSIALYESKNNEIKIQERFYIDYGLQAWNSFKEIFDETMTANFFGIKKANNKIPLSINVAISGDVEKMHYLFNNYWSWAGVIRQYNNMLRDHLEYLGRFIIYLKKNYDLDI